MDIHPYVSQVLCGGCDKTRLGEEAKAARAASGTKTASVKAADKKEGTTSTECNAADTSVDNSSKKEKKRKDFFQEQKSKALKK